MSTYLRTEGLKTTLTEVGVSHISDHEDLNNISADSQICDSESDLENASSTSDLEEKMERIKIRLKYLKIVQVLKCGSRLL